MVSRNNQSETESYPISILCSSIRHHEIVFRILIHCHTDWVFNKSRSIQVSNDKDGDICRRLVLWLSAVICWNFKLKKEKQSILF